MINHTTPPGDASDMPLGDGDREALLTSLLPRLYAAAGSGLAELSVPEMRALASHPDDGAALVLLAGLAGRAEAADPEVSPEEAAALLAELSVTPEVIRRLIVDGVLPEHPRRSDVLDTPAGCMLAARRAEIRESAGADAAILEGLAAATGAVPDWGDVPNAAPPRDEKGGSALGADVPDEV